MNVQVYALVVPEDAVTDRGGNFFPGDEDFLVSIPDVDPPVWLPGPPCGMVST